MAMTEMSDDDIYITLLGSLFTITSDDALGWYLHCGYI
jgi:hypothetical protein